MASPLPVLLLGETHNRATHYLVERDTLRYVQAAGYDTLTLEWPCDFDPALRTYLASDRTPKDYDAVLDRWHAMRKASAALSDDPEHYNKGADASFLKTLWLAEDAADLGYGVRCIDSFSEGRLRRPGESEKAFMTRRNVDMAEKIAQAVQEGRRLVVETGSAHLFGCDGSSSLVEQLKQRAVPIEGFEILGQGSINPANCRESAPHARSIAAFLEKRGVLGSSTFQRPIPAIPGPQWGIHSRQRETLQRTLERDRRLGHDFEP